MKSTLFADLWDPIRTLSRALFDQLPPQYGNTLPPELRLFEAQMQEAQRHPYVLGEAPHAHHAASKPIKVGSGNRPQAA